MNQKYRSNESKDLKQSTNHVISYIGIEKKTVILNAFYDVIIH